MHKLKSLSLIIVLGMFLSLAYPSFIVFARPLGQISATLGAAESYSVLAGSIVTNTGATTTSRDVGVSPGIGVPPLITGFTGLPDGTVNAPGAIHEVDAHSAAAQAANTTAFGFIDQTCTVTYPTGTQELGGLSLGPGVYCADAFEISGPLTLSGDGVWIFKSSQTLVTASGSSVSIPDGDPCSVWWRVVSSATLGTNSTFTGNILALTSISLETGATLTGRALAQTGAVTLDTNTINPLVCAVPPVVEEEDNAISALPATGGAPIQDGVSPWSLVMVGGFSAMALVFGIRSYRKTSRSK